LGIVQPWDPDYDLKFGVNFATAQSTHIRNSGVLSGASSGGVEGVSARVGSGAILTTVNLMICVDHQYDGLSGEYLRFSVCDCVYFSILSLDVGDNDIGGWAATGSIVPGITFRMALVGKIAHFVFPSHCDVALLHRQYPDCHKRVPSADVFASVERATENRYSLRAEQ
jgi:hypothetical protein